MQVSSVEKRQYQRYSTSELITLCQSNICDIINISLGGYTVRCLAETHPPNTWMSDILRQNGEQYLQSFPVRKVWSRPHDDSTSFFLAGVKFINLSPKQKSDLKQLIQEIANC